METIDVNGKKGEEFCNNKIPPSVYFENMLVSRKNDSDWRANILHEECTFYFTDKDIEYF